MRDDVNPIEFAARIQALPEVQRQPAIEISRAAEQITDAWSNCLIAAIVGGVAGLFLGGLIGDALTSRAFRGDEHVFALALPWFFLDGLFRSMPFVIGGGFVGGIAAFVAVRAAYFTRRRNRILTELQAKLKGDERYRAAARSLARSDRTIHRFLVRNLAEALLS